MAEPPSGTVTFLFTDIEGSTRMWEHNAEIMHTALALHDDILTRREDLGERRLKNLFRPERVFQVTVPDLLRSSRR